METDPYQQSPEYTQHTLKIGTHREQAPSHPLVHTTCTHQHQLQACSGQRYAEAAHTDKCREGQTKVKKDEAQRIYISQG